MTKKSNSSSLKRLSEKCRQCPFVDKCDNKEMEAVGYLKSITSDTGVDASAPVLRETITVYADGKPTLRYKDEIEKELAKSLHNGLGMQFGA